MSGLPRVPGWTPGWFYIIQSFKRILETIFEIKQSQVYKACVVTAALNWKTRITLDSMGV
jgi:hypothetical protein